MKAFLISENHDTALGLRLAGVDGKIAHDKEEVLKIYEEVKKDENIATVFITRKLYSLCKNEFDKEKLSSGRPLIVEIPDRHLKPGEEFSRLSEYVKDALGINI